MPGAGAYRGVRFLRRASASAAAAARARRAIGRAFSAFVCGVTRVPPPLGVRCALFSVFVGVGRVSSALIKLTCCSVGLRLRAPPSGFACRSPPDATTSTQKPWPAPVVVRACPTKHPRHTAVVFTIYDAPTPPCGVLEGFLTCICCDRPRPHTESGCPSVALLICFASCIIIITHHTAIIA